MEKKIEGFFGGILDFLEDIWDAIVGAVTAAWEAVVEAVNWLIDLVISAVKAFFDYVLSPIVQSIYSMAQSLLSAIQGAISNALTAENLARTLVSIIIGSAVFMFIMAMVGGLCVINTLTNLVTGGLYTLLSNVAGVMVTLIIGYFIAMAASEMAGVDISSIVPESVDSGISASFKLSKIAVYLGFFLATQTRELESLRSIAPVGLGVALLGITIFAAKSMVVKGVTKLSYGIALIFDIISIGLLVYSIDKLKNLPWVKTWYKVMDIAQKALGWIGLGSVVASALVDISGFITAEG